MTTREPHTKAARAFLANLVGRFGGSATDPVSWQLTVEDMVAIEDQAVETWWNGDEAQAVKDRIRTEAEDDIIRRIVRLNRGEDMDLAIRVDEARIADRSGSLVVPE